MGNTHKNNAKTKAYSPYVGSSKVSTKRLLVGSISKPPHPAHPNRLAAPQAICPAAQAQDRKHHRTQENNTYDPNSRTLAHTDALHRLAITEERRANAAEAAYPALGPLATPGALDHLAP